MAVETPVGQPGALHDVGDANPVKTVLPKERAGHMHNLLPVRRRLLARHSHGSTPFRNLWTLYMIVVINNHRPFTAGP